MRPTDVAYSLMAARSMYDVQETLEHVLSVARRDPIAKPFISCLPHAPSAAATPGLK
jgi:hypothetical protein